MTWHAGSIGVAGAVLAGAVAWGAEGHAQDAIPPVGVTAMPAGRMQLVLDPRSSSTVQIQQVADGRFVAAPLQCTASCEAMLPLGQYRLTTTRAYRITAERDVSLGAEGARWRITYESSSRGDRLRTAAFVTLAAGGAALLTGTVMFGAAAFERTWDDTLLVTGAVVGLAGALLLTTAFVLLPLSSSVSQHGTQHITEEPLARVSFGAAPLAGGGGMAGVTVRF